ncbi:MAG: DUF5686 family protein [Bacteroidales bacterium]
MKIKIVVLFLLCYTQIFAQKIAISGYVKDSETKDPISFSNVWVKGSYNGIATNADGFFSLKVNLGDTLCASSLGYANTELVVKKSNIRSFTIFLKDNAVSIEGVVVKPKVDFAKELLKKIIDNKKQNLQSIASVQEYKTLANTTIYLALDSILKTSNFVDTLKQDKVEDEQSLTYTPIFLSEEASNVKDNTKDVLFSNKNGIFPKLNQTIESLVTQYLVVDLDFYKNQIYIFDKGFISPISNNALLFYNFYFNDSTRVNNQKIYNLSFSPKNKFAPLFTGRFSIDSASMGIIYIETYFRKEANVNFVSGFKGSVLYTKQEDGGVFLAKQEININLAISLKKDTSQYASKRVDNVSNGNWVLNKTTYYSTDKTLNTIKASEWKNQEEFKLKKFNADDDQKIKKTKERPIIKTIDAIGGMVLSSYINLPTLDIGPVFDIYSTNAVEGNRFSIPLRTGEHVFKYFTVGGFIGYGTKSDEYKFGANVAWEPFKSDKYIVRLSYSDDYAYVSQDKFLRFIKKNPNTRGNGNFIATITTNERDPYLKEEKTVDLRLEYNADKNIGVEVSPYFKQNISTLLVRFIRNGVDYNKYQNYGMLINCRFAFGQHYDKIYFARIYYLTRIPVVNIGLDMGRVRFANNDSNKMGLYSQIHGSIQGMCNLGIIVMRYMLNSGFVLGDAPYDMLDMPAGTMSLGYSKYGYNLLEHATFAHNLYANAHLEFSGGGVFFNHIPGIRRLKLREMFSIKSHYGTLNNAYKGVFDLPQYYNNKFTYPYVEMGVGVSNIFKVFRIEYVRQIGDYYKTNNLASKEGIRIRAELSF